MPTDFRATHRVATEAPRVRAQFAIWGVWVTVKVVDEDVVLNFAAAREAVFDAIGVVDFEGAVVADVEVRTRIIPRRAPARQPHLDTAAWFIKLPVGKLHQSGRLRCSQAIVGCGTITKINQSRGCSGHRDMHGLWGLELDALRVCNRREYCNWLHRDGL